MTGQSFDIRLLMEKGYLAPLTAQPDIREALEQMYAPILEQMTYNGEIYGVPYGCSILYQCVFAGGMGGGGLDEGGCPGLLHRASGFSGCVDSPHGGAAHGPHQRMQCF